MHCFIGMATTQGWMRSGTISDCYKVVTSWKLCIFMSVIVANTEIPDQLLLAVQDVSFLFCFI